MAQDGQSERAVFLDGSLMRHVSTMSFTASIGLLAIFLVDFVDMIFISMLGNDALAAAIGYAGAILFSTTSVSIGVSIAAGVLIARSLGAGDLEHVRQRATNIMVFGVVVGILVAGLVWLNLRPLLALVGATGETADLALRYLRIIIPSMPLLMVGMAGGAILRAHGDARRAMYATVAGGAVNAVLDPILIFGLGLGLDGAAIASVLARVTILFVSLYPVVRHYGGFARFDGAALRADIAPIAGLAVPAILTNLATPVGTAYVTRAMAAFGEDAVAGMAIVGRLTPVAFCVIFALSGAIGPIVGQNAGAGQFDRVRFAYREGILFTGLYTLAVSAALFALREPLAALFQAEGETRVLLFLFCGPLSLAWFFNGVIFVGNAGFNNLGHPFYSTLVNWGRNTLGTVPLVWLGAQWFGAPGVLIGLMAGGVIFAALSALMVRRVIAESAAGGTAGPKHRFSARIRWLQLFGHRR
ncbi:MATE family efflux transporter [Oceanomicrobium pacificus]|uniref:Multidrug-efflux transporter n=1 Tax=Oceanomicrobium pacificus TaxID=2692916 RepID=A0A6B0TPQ2_9RHOB|nr:MATE family efflux transporter [Oceanomicrobium pacificus]MXU64639.1 MATE family efflux transporter [Oceanomicrobium pacificus]